MCKFCSKSRTESLDVCGALTIKNAVLRIHYSPVSVDSSWEEEIDINFCPMCGEDLEHITEDTPQ